MPEEIRVFPDGIALVIYREKDGGITAKMYCICEPFKTYLDAGIINWKWRDVKSEGK